jgi:hypothetical protein
MIPVLLKSGRRRTFASALDWPGWSRGRSDEASALQALMEYGPRYAQALVRVGVELVLPASSDELTVVERQPGNATTDFGAPGVVMAADRASISSDELERSRSILQAGWLAFEAAVGQAAGHSLRTGPRGGGRDVARMTAHVLEANVGYLTSIGWGYRRAVGYAPAEELALVRQATLEALEAAALGALPTRGPRGGIRWPVRFYARRVAWHLLDHAWEIEDRIE